MFRFPSLLGQQQAESVGRESLRDRQVASLVEVELPLEDLDTIKQIIRVLIVRSSGNVIAHGVIQNEIEFFVCVCVSVAFTDVCQLDTFCYVLG